MTGSEIFCIFAQNIKKIKMKQLSIIFAIYLLLSSIANGQADAMRGKASFYANKFEGKTTASGEKYTHDKLTAAHKTLPFGTLVKVTNRSNSNSVTVRINDRGPFIEGRIIDVSKSAAEKLDFINIGVTEVTLEIVNNTSQSDNNPEEESIIEETSTEPNSVASSESKTPSVPIMTTSYYRLSASKEDPIGYGIQIASYQESGNLLERASIVESELKQKVTVQVVNANGNRVYRLIVGEFDSRAKAEYFKDSIKDTYQGFVVTFKP